MKGRRVFSKTALVSGVGASLLMAGALLAAEMASETLRIAPFDKTSGGHHQAVSATNYKLGSSAGKGVAASTATAPAGTLAVAPGLLRVLSYPRSITDLTGLSETAAAGYIPSTATLQWTAPGQDGNLGRLQSGASYYIRIASYTSPDTFAFSYADIVLSTQGTTPGQWVSTRTYDLLANTTYYARLWTKDVAAGMAFESNRATFTTLAKAPGALPFLEVAYTSVSVNWSALSDASHGSSSTCEGYVVEASLTDFGAAAASSMTTSATLDRLWVREPALMVETLYYFRVCSLNWRGGRNCTSLGSTTTKFQVNDPLQSPPSYTGVTDSGFSVQWNENGNPADATYTVELDLDPSFTPPDLQSESGWEAPPYAFSSLSRNTTYYLRVRATARGSDSDWLVLPETCTLAGLPAAAAEPFASVQLSSMSVRWDANGNTVGKTTYTVLLQSEAYDVRFDSSPAGAPPSATSAEGSLEQNTTYQLYAAAVNHHGVATSFVLMGSTSTKAAEPAMAGAPFPAVSYSSMTVRWQANLNPVDRTTYTVVLTTSPAYPNADEWNTSLSTLPAGSDLAATFSGLRLNTTYYLFGTARNHAGEHSAYALLGSTATLAAAPGVREDGNAYLNMAEHGLSLIWSSGTYATGFNAAHTTYTVEVSLEQDFSPLAASGYTVNLSTNVTDLSPNTTYYLRVAAYGFHHDAGWTAFTDYGSTSTLAAVPAAAAQTFSAVYLSSAGVSWSASDNPVDKTTYTLVLSPEAVYPNANPDNASLTLLASGASPSATLAGLKTNTTYYLHASAKNHNGVPTSYLGLGSTSSLAALPSGGAVWKAYKASMTLSWGSMSADGFEVQASADDFGGGTVYYSSTTDGGATSLTVSSLGALQMQADTTYFFRLGAYNHNGVASRVAVSPRSTLALELGGGQLVAQGVYETSATASWGSCGLTCQGYVLEASTADAYGVSDWGGEILSSMTRNTGKLTLSVESLMPGTTYAFRIGSLNWNDATNYAHIGSSLTSVSPMSWDAGGGDNLWYTAANWNPNGIPGPGTPVTISWPSAMVWARATDPAVQFSSLTIGSPAGTVSSLTLSTGTGKAGSVKIYGGAGLTQATTAMLYLNGGFTMLKGSTLSHTAQGVSLSSVNVKVTGTFYLLEGSTITASTAGYAGGGSCGSAGTGPGGGNALANFGGTGAGYGGQGGAHATTPPNPGATYNAAENPFACGSGGGGGSGSSCGLGGRGGGSVQIWADTLLLNGYIEAGGQGGGGGTAFNKTAGGGGSGGTVRLTAATLLGGGTVQAAGGNGGGNSAGGDSAGGGGGGGRVALWITGTGNLCEVKVSTHGGLAGGGTALAGSGGTYSSTQAIAVPGLSAVQSSSYSIKWAGGLVTGGTYYTLRDQDSVAKSTDPKDTAWEEFGLSANTTYYRYVQVQACAASTGSAVAGYATLGSTVTPMPDSYPAAGTNWVKTHWRALPSAQARGYRLEASSSAFAAGTTVFSSATLSASLSTLTVSGLQANTTYTFRVGSLNWASAVSSYTYLDSTSTLANAPSATGPEPDYWTFKVHYTSVTVAWAALPAASVHGASNTCEGYVVEASSTDFGAALPGGDVYSSATYNVSLSTLILGADAPFDACTQTYFRVASLNWTGATNYYVIGSTRNEDQGAVLAVHDFSLGSIPVNSEAVLTTGFTVANPACKGTFWLKAEPITGGTPWSIATSSGTDTFTLQAVFNAAQPGSTDFGGDDYLTATEAASSATRFALGETGVAVPYNGARTLWLKLGMPKVTSTESPQQVRVTVIGKAE
jgi:hypothetical protein